MRRRAEHDALSSPCRWRDGRRAAERGQAHCPPRRSGDTDVRQRMGEREDRRRTRGSWRRSRSAGNWTVIFECEIAECPSPQQCVRRARLCSFGQQSLSFFGLRLVWRWRSGLRCPLMDICRLPTYLVLASAEAGAPPPASRGRSRAAAANTTHGGRTSSSSSGRREPPPPLLALLAAAEKARVPAPLVLPPTALRTEESNAILKERAPPRLTHKD